jgi:hypothetical protein
MVNSKEAQFKLQLSKAKRENEALKESLRSAAFELQLV